MTPFLRAFLRPAAERAAQEAKETGRTVRFGHYGALWLDYFGAGLRAFAKKFPELALHPVELTPAELIVALRRGEVDIALLGAIDAGVAREFASRLLGTQPAILALGAANPLAKKRRHELGDLRAARWVVWDEHAFPGRLTLFRAAAAQTGFVPRVAHAVDSVASVFLHVATSDAIGYVLPMSRKLPHVGVVFAEFKPPGVAFEMHVAWRRDAPNAEILATLADHLMASTPAH